MMIEILIDNCLNTYSISYTTMFVGSHLTGEELIEESIDQRIFEKDAFGIYYHDTVYQINNPLQNDVNNL